MNEDNSSIILHIGCGLDSRVLRVGVKEHLWYDIDFEDVIALRKKYYTENEYYKMLSGDARRSDWLKGIPQNRNAVIVFEGISMYLKTDELRHFLCSTGDHFRSVSILMDCYTEKGAKATKIRNPINDVGISTAYGLDDPQKLEQDTGFLFVKEHNMTPDEMINKLHGIEKSIFRNLFGGKFSKSIYRMYEFRK